MPVPEIVSRLFSKKPLRPGPNEDELEYFQAKRIRERLAVDPAERIAKQTALLAEATAREIGLTIVISPPYCFLNENGNTDPACELADRKKFPRKSNPNRLAKLRQLISYIDKVYGYYAEVENDELCHKLDRILLKLTMYYLRDTVQPGVVRFTYHKEYTNPYAAPDAEDAVISL